MDRNLILAIALSGAVLLLWDLLITQPQRQEFEAAREAAEESAATGDLQGIAPGAIEDAPISVEEAIASAPARVAIETDRLKGSINLVGGRIDDLILLSYREELPEDSPAIRLLTPREAEHGHYIQHGWILGDDAGENALWSAPDGAVLTPQSPVTLSRVQGDVVFEKTISVDEEYMFSVAQTVRNEGSGDVAVTPYALVIQRNKPEDFTNMMILHEGPLGVIGTKLYERKYNTLAKNKDRRVDASGVGGWVGITNKYWLAATVPPQDEEIKASLANVAQGEEPIFRASYSLPARIVPAGGEIQLTSYAYGGAKDVDILQSYEAVPEKGGLGVYDFDKAVDWGHLFFLTRPIFYTLDFFGDLTGNFGV
ncbi:MAG: membrane protein insertase YidC, partial [Pseudomonadota bacterium]